MINISKTFKLPGLYLALLCGAGIPLASAETIVSFNFENTPDFNVPQATAANITNISGWSAASGTVASQNGNPGKAISIGSWTATQTLGFDFTVAPDFQLDLTSVSFDERFGGTPGAGGGPRRAFTHWNLSINGVKVADDVADLDAQDPFDRWLKTLNLTGLTGAVSVRFTGDGPYDPTGSWRVDNFSLLGSVPPIPAPVPLPAAGWLLASALAGLVASRRKPRS